MPATTSSPTPADFQLGDPVTYRGSWGEGVPVEGTIVGVGEKNGEAVYDFQPKHGGPVKWGYADQFRTLTAKAA